MVEGFTQLPQEFYKNRGRIKGGTVYYLNKMVKDKNVKEFTITREGKNSFRKYGESHKIRLNYASLRLLANTLSSISYEASTDRSLAADDLFHKFYPKKFQVAKSSPRKRANKVIEYAGKYY